MMNRQSESRVDVLRTQRQKQRLQVFQMFSDRRFRFGAKVQLSRLGFCQDLPKADSADKRYKRTVTEQPPEPWAQPLRFAERPDHRMRVEQHAAAHSPNCSSASRLSMGASQFSSGVINPHIEPSTRFLRGTGTSFATGVPWRAITTSSPSSTRSSSLERRVLASWTL